ncbi:unnamed protein product [Rhizoctonia solani]|uniref:Uncharacterized protein n=1 Tax=Rhizoctonia solani TaxID=456999 RepID=A0A8H3E6E3_9AGAM|nr:unnamed protein product [Rhizoctonia solani]
MQYVHRMPLVYRRMFATSITLSSKPRAKGEQSSKSSFAERFGSPAQPQDQDSQASFPTWPGLQPTQAPPYSNQLKGRLPSSNFITSNKDTTDEHKPSATHRYRPTDQSQLGQQPRKLFSDCIGNASSFVNTSSFEAKLAVEPAAHTFNRWMVAAKNNIERFKSIPKPVEHNFESSASCINTKESIKPGDSTIRHEALESPPKSISRVSRSPIVTPSGRRMLSTSTADASACSLLPIGQIDYQTGVADTKKHPHHSLWKLCALWALTATSEVRPHTRPIMSGFMRRLCATQHRSSLLNSSLSFFQPAFHPSLPAFARGYATGNKRRSKRQSHIKRGKKQDGRDKQIPGSTREQPSNEKRSTTQHPSKKTPVTHDSPPDIDTPCILIPAPTTQNELCNALRYLIQSTEPPIPLPRLIATHTRYPTLQTAESYNLLLAHASRVSPIPYSAQIISQLRTSGVVWSERTEQLVVRAHIQSGRWENAIQLAEKLWVNGTTSRTPLNIFTELLHFVLTKRATVGDIALMADRCWKLFPTKVDVDVINRSPRIAYNIVRLLSNAERHEYALQLSVKLIESLGSPTPSNIRYCRAILCHVIRPPRGRPSAYPFDERRRLFESLLQHNPSLGLTPDPALTCALLQNLRRRRKRGSIAFHTLLELRAKYGPQVEDSAVRRTIARYAMDEENLDLARSIFERERLARLENSKPRSAKTVLGAPWVGQEALPTQSHLEYLRNKGIDNRKFTVTARSLHRRELRSGRREQIRPQNLLAAEKQERKRGSMHPGQNQRVIESMLATSDTSNDKKGT